MMHYIFWISLITLIYIYIGYLGITILLGIFFRKPLEKKDILPTVSLIIPAFNEEKVIGEKIENSLNLDYPKEKIEIVLASDSDDRTNNIASQYLNKGITLYTYETRQGKSKMLYEIVPKTKGEIIVLSDANAIYKKDALRKLVRNFHDQRIGGVLGRLIITNPGDSSISAGESMYKKYEGLLRKYNSRQHSVLGADGSMLAIRRGLYFPISPARGDDFELAVRILIKGFGVIFEPEAISYEKASIFYQDEIKRKIRIVSWFLKSSFLLLKEMIRSRRGYLIFQLISNKLLRWSSPYFLILLFLSNLALYETHLFYRLTLAGQILFYTIPLICLLYLKKHKKRPPRLLKLIFYFITFNYAFLLGVWRGLFCKPRPFWQKVR